jgi:hypothetical protein
MRAPMDAQFTRGRTPFLPNVDQGLRKLYMTNKR